MMNKLTKLSKYLTYIQLDKLFSKAKDEDAKRRDYIRDVHKYMTLLF